jgi:sugar/nucleoside kinase (ribokinase family)
MKLNPGSCLVIGGCTIDAVVDPQGIWQKNLCGGNSLFAAAGANYWLAPQTVKIISRVGQDYPQDWLEMVSRAGMDISGIERVDFPHQGVFAASYDPLGHRTMHAEEIVDEQLKRPTQPRADLVGIDRLNLDPVLNERFSDSLDAVCFIHCAPVQPAALFQNLAVLRRPGFWLQADPGEESAAWSIEERAAVLQRVDAYLPSAEEVDETTRQMLNEISRDTQSSRPHVIAIKQGIQGSEVFQRSTYKRQAIPVIPVEARDPTGAGDAYCGGFLAGMALTGNPFIAGLTGTVSASFVVECSGVLKALMPASHLLWERLEWLEKRIEFQLNAEDEHRLRTARSY